MAHTSEPLASINSPSRLVLVVLPVLPLDKVSHDERPRVRLVVGILAPLAVDFHLPLSDGLPVLLALKVRIRIQIIVLSLLPQMLLKALVREEAPYAGLHLCNSISMSPIELLVIDVTQVLL
mgnify:CR=1 FL=1